MMSHDHANFHERLAFISNLLREHFGREVSITHQASRPQHSPEHSREPTLIPFNTTRKVLNNTTTSSTVSTMACAPASSIGIGPITANAGSSINAQGTPSLRSRLPCLHCFQKLSREPGPEISRSVLICRKSIHDGTCVVCRSQHRIAAQCQAVSRSSYLPPNINADE